MSMYFGDSSCHRPGTASAGSGVLQPSSPSCSPHDWFLGTGPHPSEEVLHPEPVLVRRECQLSRTYLVARVRGARA